jgi:amino acid transporter
MLDVVSLNLGNMSAGAALGAIGYIMIDLSSTSGVNLVYGSIIAWLLSIPEIVVYTMMTTRISRTGGDYIWVSRVYGGLFGGALAFMGYTLETPAYFALIAMEAVSAIGGIGLFYGLSWGGPLIPGASGANTVGQFGIAALIFLVVVGVNAFKPKAGYKLVSVTVIISILATFVAIFALLAGGTAAVQSYINSLSVANTTYTSVATSYSGPTFDLGATIFMLPFYYIYAYPWLNAGPAVASEIKGKGALRYNVAISSIVTLIIVTGGFAAMYYAGGFGFINAALGNFTLVVSYGFSFWTLAMGVTTIAPLQWFIALGSVLWEVAIIAYGVIVLSRYLFAQSFDRFLPEKIAYVNPSRGSPTVALLIELVACLFLLGLAVFNWGPMSTLFGAVIASMIYFVFVGIAALLYALKNEKGQSKAVLAIFGILMAIVFAYVSYQFVAYNAIWSYPGWPANWLGFGWTIASFIAGLVIYAISKSYYGKRGIDITLAYKELPPL